MKRKGLKTSSYISITVAFLLILTGLFALWSASYALSPEGVAATETVRASLPTFDLFGTTDTACLKSTNPEHEIIERRANIKLPPSMKHLYVHAIAFMDCTVYVRFEMSPNDLPSLLTSSYVSELRPRMGSDISFPESAIDWSFDETTEYLYGEGNDVSGLEWQTIIIDPTDADRYTVYVITVLL